MTATRWIPAVTVLCALGALSACSGDGDSPDASPSTSSSATQEATQEPKQRTCKVQVEVTGAAQASWTGKGESRTATSGPEAIYTAAQGDAQVAIYSSGQDFTSNANVTIGGDTFSTAAGDDTGLDAGTNGKGASVDADAGGVDPASSVHLTASFDC